MLELRDPFCHNIFSYTEYRQTKHFDNSRTLQCICNVRLAWRLLYRHVICFAVVSAVELTVRPLGSEFYKPLGSSMVFTCQLELSKQDLENDGADVAYSIKWFDANNNREIRDTTGRLMFFSLSHTNDF